LYAELDSISAAWEALDRQVKAKVFDLSAMEERLTKAGIDRAKAENKFYTAMRDKEAVENERKNLSRTLEKQSKALEKLVESEAGLKNRVEGSEKELGALRKNLLERLQKEKALEEEAKELRLRAEGESKRVEDMRATMAAREKELDGHRAELRKSEESLLRAKKEIERQTAKLKASSTNLNSTASSREAQLQSEIDKCMRIIKCSTCQINIRNTVITKCMHSFCKQCIESRISTRQRKCPACNLPFSQGEVQPLFFQ